jgi:hypothetical protein
LFSLSFFYQIDVCDQIDLLNSFDDVSLPPKIILKPSHKLIVKEKFDYICQLFNRHQPHLFRWLPLNIFKWTSLLNVKPYSTPCLNIDLFNQESWAQIINEFPLGRTIRKNRSSIFGKINFWLKFTYPTVILWITGPRPITLNIRRLTQKKRV